MNKAIEKKLYTVLQDVLRVEITDDLSINNVSSWDSLCHLQLLAKIDETFGIDIDFEDSLTMSSIRSIKKIIDKYVKNK